MSITVHRVSKTFGSFRALDDISLTVPTGHLVALLGPSGSGKTTLLRIIAGLEEADGGVGDIRFDDEDVARTHVRERRVGFVFQHYALFRHLTVFENIAFGLRVRPRRHRPAESAIRAKVRDLLALVQLDGLAARYPSQLSGGQRQRVALARALAVEPRVLLLDEPFGALDARVRKELRAWLRRLHDELHVTSVFVTHDQDEALEVADQVVVMNRGRVEQVGTPDEVFHHPASEFVMNFLGEVNRFHGRIDAGRVRLAPSAGDARNTHPASPDGASIEFPYEGSGEAGRSATVFVRPHDVTIDTVATENSIDATVVRLHSAGPFVRVELRTDGGQGLVAELSQERFRSMRLQPGATVFIRPRHVRVFADGH
jgi:sulfate transport system ATP-binding protein